MFTLEAEEAEEEGCGGAAAGREVAEEEERHWRDDAEEEEGEQEDSRLPGGDVRTAAAALHLRLEEGEGEPDEVDEGPEEEGLAREREAREEILRAREEDEREGLCRDARHCRSRHTHPGAGANTLRVLDRRYEVGGSGTMLARLESLWQQFKVLELKEERRKSGKPQPLLVCGSLFAGHGQALWGPGHGHRVDLLVVTDPGRIQMTNFHGSYWHYEGHEEGCRLSLPSDPLFTVDPDTAAFDSFREQYAEAMSQPRSGHLKFSYGVELECSVFHRREVTSARTGKAYGSVGMALKRAYPQESIHPPPFRSVTQAALIGKIMAGDPAVGGFVTVAGGMCDYHDDKVGAQFSFCMQRAPPRRYEVGKFTLAQLRASCGDNEAAYQKKLDALLKSPLTLGKHYYEEHGETIGTQLLRWLIRERGFRGFRIIHYLHYNCRSYFRPFLEPLLQVRHDIKRGVSDFSPDGVRLAEQAIKVILCGE